MAVVIQVLGLVLSGLLAGEELVVRWGVQPALSSLGDRAHVEARVALVKRLKVVVPMIMVPTTLVAIAVVVTSIDRPGATWRWVGALALLAFLLYSFLGTVPINMKVNDWSPEAPPADWRDVVRRWQRIDVFRSTAAIVSFVAFAVGVAGQLT